MKQKIEAAADSAGVGFEVRSIDRRKAGGFAPHLVALAEQVAQQHGETARHLDTTGGHDAVALSAVCPSIVLAVRSQDGVIHHPTEFSSEQDRALAAQILADMLYAIAREGLPGVEPKRGAA
jgi:beta-ureidopropionase / N-carbamoyl-L-amino-acid hydrolase